MPRVRSVGEMRDRLRNELRALRAAADLTQAEAGVLCGISELQYGKYERGESEIPASILEFARQGFRLVAAGSPGLQEDAAPYAAQPAGGKEVLERELRALRNQIDRSLKAMEDFPTA